MKRRLAMACARGVRQQSLINELLAYPVGWEIDSHSHWKVGAEPLGYDSFKNLRARLVANGFVLKTDRRTITMFFPEEM